MILRKSSLTGVMGSTNLAVLTAGQRIVKVIIALYFNFFSFVYIYTDMCLFYSCDLGVYCLQYDDEKIVSGLRDNTIKVFLSFSLCLFGFTFLCVTSLFFITVL